MSVKNSNDIIGNRTRDLPTCTAVPQPTAPPRTRREYTHTHTHIYKGTQIFRNLGPSQNFKRQAGDTDANSVLRTHHYAPNLQKLVADIKWRQGFVHPCIHKHIKKGIYLHQHHHHALELQHNS
jgi:hypothetical protein